jgi:hypothetical protein
MRKEEVRKKEAKGSINIGKCQDTKHCPIYTTIIVLVIENYKWILVLLKKKYAFYLYRYFIYFTTVFKIVGFSVYSLLLFLKKQLL